MVRSDLGLKEQPARQRASLRCATMVACSAALLLSGCMSFGGRGGLSPLPATPTQPVATNTLPAPATLPDTNTSVETTTLEDAVGVTTDGSSTIETAVAPGLSNTADTGSSVTEDDLIGVWSASTTAATCSINLSLTTWTGGFRGSTRSCGDPQLANLGAWSVEGRQVLLKDGEGNTLARLFRTAEMRYAGQLENGQAVTVFR